MQENAPGVVIKKEKMYSQNLIEGREVVRIRLLLDGMVVCECDDKMRVARVASQPYCVVRPELRVQV